MPGWAWLLVGVLLGGVVAFVGLLVYFGKAFRQ